MTDKEIEELRNKHTTGSGRPHTGATYGAALLQGQIQFHPLGHSGLMWMEEDRP